MVRLLPVRCDGRPRLSLFVFPRSRSLLGRDSVLSHLHGRFCGSAAGRCRLRLLRRSYRSQINSRRYPLLMGLSTVAIGLLPTASTIGVAAPFLLTLLRFLQGIGVGGEWGGAVLLALEYSHRGKRGFYASWPQAGVPLGLLTSAGVVALFESWLSPADFLAWGWRVPFLLSGLLIVVGLLIRVRILETPLFRQLQQTQQVAHS